jgi:hypothetical protein
MVCAATDAATRRDVISLPAGATLGWRCGAAGVPPSGRRPRMRVQSRRAKGIMSPPPDDPADLFRGAEDIVHPTDPLLLRLVQYWDAKRGTRLMPARAEIDPVELRGLVNHVVLYDVVEAGRLYRVRLVGEAIMEFSGINATGAWAGSNMPPAAAAKMLEILNSVVAGRAPRFRSGYAHWHFDKSYRKFEACFLPLSPDGVTVDKILAGVTFGSLA